MLPQGRTRLLITNTQVIFSGKRRAGHINLFDPAGRRGYNYHNSENNNIRTMLCPPSTNSDPRPNLVQRSFDIVFRPLVNESLGLQHSPFLCIFLERSIVSALSLESHSRKLLASRRERLQARVGVAHDRLP